MYRLWRSWGVPVALYRVTDSVVDRKTGKIELVTEKIKIRHGVKTPVDEKYFKGVKIGDIGLIVALNETPGREDYFVIDGFRYSVVSHQTVDEGIYFHLRKVQKQIPHQELEGVRKDHLELGDNNASN